MFLFPAQTAVQDFLPTVSLGMLFPTEELSDSLLFVSFPKIGLSSAMWQQQQQPTYYYNPNEERPQEGDDQDGDEQPIERYPLPPLPDPRLPETVNGVSANEVYQVIRALRRRLEDESGEAERELQATLGDESEKHVTMAVFQVLHESGLLRDEDGELIEQPVAPAPMLPPSCKSWIYKEPAPGQQNDFVAVDPSTVNRVKAEVKTERTYGY